MMPNLKQCIGHALKHKFIEFQQRFEGMEASLRMNQAAEPPIPG
jgi:hypothetical protein